MNLLIKYSYVSDIQLKEPTEGNLNLNPKQNIRELSFRRYRKKTSCICREDLEHLIYFLVYNFFLSLS